jgi:16S rRNA A1518/A1519 N6-dimethyltransferase RsmA/KsgA/DIM1 with predicted DNA glycosylase/AP lyase activity
MTDEEIFAIADAAKGQYFLTAPDKLALLVQAAGIRPTDHVVEIGAGIGTVARTLPPCASLTLIELDSRFTDTLRANVPHAQVIQGDGLTLLHSLRCDVLLSNLPAPVTESLIGLLPDLQFRTAVISMSTNTPLDRLKPHFDCETLAFVGGDDFQPPQPVQSRLVKIASIPQHPLR